MSLKDSVSISEDKQGSDTLYVRGLISKHTDLNQLRSFLTIVEDPTELDFSERHRGVFWVRYSSISIADKSLKRLEQTLWNGRSISVRFELGSGSDKKALHHVTPIRTLRTLSDQSGNTTFYTNKSLISNGTEYPIPSGLYFKRLIKLQQQCCSSSTKHPLYNLLIDSSLHSKYNKEITEVMSMVDAVERSIKMNLRKEIKDVIKAKVYVVGDGKSPLCCACLYLHCPMTWQYYSIDPILEPIDLVEPYNQNFFQFACRSEEFFIPATDLDCLSVLVACHSHAPLQEIWSRLPDPKLCITMPCCSSYSDLIDDPVFAFDDFEVYSPKRKVFCYVSGV